jgi:hypothetical protein
MSDPIDSELDKALAEVERLKRAFARTVGERERALDRVQYTEGRLLEVRAQACDAADRVRRLQKELDDVKFISHHKRVKKTDDE